MIPDLRENRDAALAARSAVIWSGLRHASRAPAYERRPAEEDGHPDQGGGDTTLEPEDGGA